MGSPPLQLESGGSTHGSAGIQTAYDLAADHFLREGANRVILCTDGDFNVGVTNRAALVNLIEAKADFGVFLTVLGFGQGHLQDSSMEQLANKGNGMYAYIDSLSEARRVLVSQMSASLVTIAKDVKIQVEFNPAHVRAWRLLGYENRLLADEDFNDDTIDAGEIGAGHTVTALYQIGPVGEELPHGPRVDPLKYQKTEASAKELSEAALSGELLTIQLRYQQPEGNESILMTEAVNDEPISLAESSEDTRFTAAVAAFGMRLRNSPHIGDFSYEDVTQLARPARGDDEKGYRAEFLRLVGNAQAVSE